MTGASSGLGLEAVKHCARFGATTLILAVQDTVKGKSVARDLRDQACGCQSNLVVWPLDLWSFKSVTAFASKALGLERIDAVIHNAGMTTFNWRLVDGWESILMTNVLGPLLLTLLLLPKLQHVGENFNASASVSFVVSESHFVAQFEERWHHSSFAALNSEGLANKDDRLSFKLLLLQGIADTRQVRHHETHTSPACTRASSQVGSKRLENAHRELPYTRGLPHLHSP